VGATVRGMSEGQRRATRAAALARARHLAEWAAPPCWVTRAQAQEILGLSRAKVDNLRRAGVLASERNPHTGAVRVSRSSVEAEAARRAGQ